MPDPRFFPVPEPVQASELAKRYDLTLEGDDVTITGCQPLNLAGPGDLSFVAKKSFLDHARASRAGAIIVTPRLAGDIDGVSLLVTDAPQLAYARIAEAFYSAPSVEKGIAAGAHVDPSATLGPDVRIAAGAVISARAEVGEGSEIAAGAVVGPGVVIGPECWIGPGAKVDFAILGARVRLFAGSVIGQAGFGYVPGPRGLQHVPQLGRVIIGDDVDIGANTTIDRGAGDDTVIGQGTKIDNQVQIGHNCRIGAHCVIVSQVGLSGSITVGDRVQMGGKSGAAEHVTIGEGARLAAGTGVIKDVAPGEVLGGRPAAPIREWQRQCIALANLAKGKKP